MAQNECGGVKFTSYSGAYTTSEVTMDGVKYTLYTLTGSGTLVLKGRGKARVWMCGGGANGRGGTYTSPNRAYPGAGGGGGYTLEGELASGTYTVQIGSAQGTTSFAHAKGDILSAAGATSANGASGGGAADGRTSGTGKGISTYPFGITSLYAHSAGGGGGTRTYHEWDDEYSGYTSQVTYGGNGGSNGSNGSSTSYSNTTTSKGGSKGGGAGNGGKASFYGSGGGGGRAFYESDWMDDTYYGHSVGTGGAGYQGVAYVLVEAA